MQNERTGDLSHSMLHQGPIVGHRQSPMAESQIPLTRNTTTTSPPDMPEHGPARVRRVVRLQQITGGESAIDSLANARNERLSTSFIILTARYPPLGPSCERHLATFYLDLSSRASSHRSPCPPCRSPVRRRSIPHTHRSIVRNIADCSSPSIRS